MKVFVVTKAGLFQPEIYITVKGTRKEAEKVIRAEFPNARTLDGGKSFNCRKDGVDLIMFIHEENI